MMKHQLRLTHQPDHAVTIGDGEQVILTYQYGAGLRYPYCHPVNLPDGPSITLHKPFDHPWHLGLYFAWKYIDRKSTRLNSSHANISYAVFCLKKKKRITITSSI